MHVGKRSDTDMSGDDIIMTQAKQSLRDGLKSGLRRVGLYDHALRMRRLLDPKRMPYRFIRKYKTTIKGVAVEFSTRDDYSNSWFFPRYAGGRIHERAVTDKMVNEFQNSKCFVDVGTHLGWYTCLAAKHMPNGIVYGFEMDDMFFHLLKKNVALNKCDNVEAYNVAVFDSAGTVNYRREDNRYSPGFRLRTNTTNGSSNGVVSVQSVALDDFFQEEGVVPDLIKVDVEGAEMNVLMGMRNTLQAHKPVLFLEVHPSNLNDFDTSVTEILALLADANYEVFEIEDMRNQDARGQMTPLNRDAVMEDNTMLYATAKGMTKPQPDSQ